MLICTPNRNREFLLAFGKEFRREKKCVMGQNIFLLLNNRCHFQRLKGTGYGEVIQNPTASVLVPDIENQVIACEDLRIKPKAGTGYHQSIYI
jgi:hypothetical protein